jgi:diaminohydroxyphosphoribosylaminopyrimidine deaminase/5-amino-6-(5-phosphoribosylamino)uracil reductase
MKPDERYMRMALSLAKRAEGMTSPNPLVGAVIVRGGKVVGSGYHKRAGLPHAEINAIEDAGRKANGAVLYVTLEPCDHFGRTPPCTDAIINSGIKTVVIATPDPNPLTGGRGIKMLKRHGIKTVVGILKDEARSMNKAFEKRVTKNMPYVTVKSAESIDGKIATRTGDSKWITSEDSRRYVHRLRALSDAVMVGVNTIIKDDPLLTSRIQGSRQPVRIIVDSHLRTPLNAKIFSNIKRAPLIIVTIGKSSKIGRYVELGAEVIIVKAKGGMVDLRALLKELAKREITSILVEGGGNLNAKLLEESLADKVLFFISPKIIGGRDAITSVEGRGAKNVKDAVKLKNIKLKKFRDDILIEAEVA